jgi:hypothetical protein
MDILGHHSLFFFFGFHKPLLGKKYMLRAKNFSIFTQTHKYQIEGQLLDPKNKKFIIFFMSFKI